MLRGYRGKHVTWPHLDTGMSEQKSFVIQFYELGGHWAAV